MNMFKKNGGFTLVELIVVIAILAILAAVAVPAYSGYITKAQDAGDSTALASIKTAALGALATNANGSVEKIVVTSTAADGITKIVAFFDDTKTADADGVILYDIKNTDTTKQWPVADFKAFMNNEMVTLKGSFKATTATWTAADSKWK